MQERWMETLRKESGAGGLAVHHWVCSRAGELLSSVDVWIWGPTKGNTWLVEVVWSRDAGDQFRFVQVAFEASLKHPNIQA